MVPPLRGGCKESPRPWVICSLFAAILPERPQLLVWSEQHTFTVRSKSLALRGIRDIDTLVGAFGLHSFSRARNDDYAK